jgi:proto-oncogene C-crk
LNTEDEVGVFLVRNSSTIVGDLVLCVREDNRVSHYIINKVQQSDEQIRFRIGDQLFPDVPALLHHYKTNLLDTTALRRPIEKLDALEKVVAKFDFAGRDPEDLPFKKGDTLYILSKYEDQWWTARDVHGKHGIIPVPYVFTPSALNGASLNDLSDSIRSSPPPSIGSHPQMTSPLNFASPSSVNINSRNGNDTVDPNIPANGREPPSYGTPNIERSLPAKAKVVQGRIPSPYDKTALRLVVGDVITVTKTNINGQWEGELNGKVGHFPFTHVTFIEEESPAAQE